MSSLNRRYFPRLPPENDPRFAPVDPGPGCRTGAHYLCFGRSERCFVASNCFVWSSAETGRPNPLVMGSSPILPTNLDSPVTCVNKLPGYLIWLQRPRTDPRPTKWLGLRTYRVASRPAEDRGDWHWLRWQRDPREASAQLLELFRSVPLRADRE